jgi:hypothetical protein
MHGRRVLPQTRFGKSSRNSGRKKRWIDPKKSVSDWFKPGEHFLSFAQIFERDAITELEKLIPHGEDIWIFVRGVDRFLRLPY